MALAALMFTASCSRPLSDAEAAFARDLFGPTLEVNKVRVAQGVGITPLYETTVNKVTRVHGTNKACLRTPQPRGAQPPQAFAFKNRVHFETGGHNLQSSRAVELADALVGWADGL